MIKVVILVLFLILNANAEEVPEGTQKPSEAAAPEAVTPDQKASKELTEVEKQVSTLGAKVKAKNDSIENLLKQKSVEQDPDKLSEIVKLVQQEHRDLEKLTQEYNIQLSILQYRFPERGLKAGRRYQRLNTKSLDEMEKTMGLESHLKKSREKIKKVYGIQEKKPTFSKDKKKILIEEESLLQPATLSK